MKFFKLESFNVILFGTLLATSSTAFAQAAGPHGGGGAGNGLTPNLQFPSITREGLQNAGGDLYLKKPTTENPTSPYMNVGYASNNQDVALNCGNLQIAELNKALRKNPTLLNLSNDIRIIAEEPSPYVSHSDGSSGLWELSFLADHIMIEFYLKSENGKCTVTKAEELTDTKIFQARINDSIKYATQSDTAAVNAANANTGCVSGAEHLIPMPLHTVITNNQ